MILVTGFAPYREEYNASQELIASYMDTLPEELSSLKSDLALEVIACDDTSRESEHQSLEARLEQLLSTHRPKSCVFVGQAPPYNKIVIERLGTNTFMDLIIDPDRPTGYWSNVPGLDTMLEELEASRIPGAYSFNAGQHLCNHVLFSSLHIESQGIGSHKSVFIHIPVLPVQVITQYPHSPSMSLQDSRRALSVILNHVASRSNA